MPESGERPDDSHEAQENQELCKNEKIYSPNFSSTNLIERDAIANSFVDYKVFKRLPILVIINMTKL